MNRAARVALLGSGMLLWACAPAEPDIELALGDAEDYMEWLIEEGEVVPPLPFDADPLVVDAIGEVRAVPDVAVITAEIEAKNATESVAVDAVSKTLNAVQETLSGRDIQTGFTALRSVPRYDQACQNANAAAQRRYYEIQQDWFFNKRLDDAGDTETRRRPAKRRLSKRVCSAQTIAVTTDMVIRVSPASDAGEVLRAMGEAGVSASRLVGYDFSDYDGLYQQAADNAVTRARAKADAVASGAKGMLGEIVDMQVSPPMRLGRFGPQPTVIRPPQPSSGDGRPAINKHLRRQENQDEEESKYARYNRAPESIASQEPPPGFTSGRYEDEIIVTATKRSARPSGRFVSAQSMQANLQDNMDFSGQGGTNALAMSLFSGPQTITVSATLAYDYVTPLDGVLIVEPED